MNNISQVMKYIEDQDMYDFMYMLEDLDIDFNSGIFEINSDSVSAFGAYYEDLDFSKCTNAIRVTKDAFSLWEHDTDIYLPDSIQEIEDYAFYNCFLYSSWNGDYKGLYIYTKSLKKVAKNAFVDMRGKVFVDKFNEFDLIDYYEYELLDFLRSKNIKII